MTGLCECGCGHPTGIAVSNDASKGHVKGQPFRYVRGHGNRAAVVRADARAIAYYAGAADKRYGRPRRVDLADRGVIAERYHAGYDATETRAVAS